MKYRSISILFGILLSLFAHKYFLQCPLCQLLDNKTRRSMQKNETFSFSKERAFHLIPSIAIFFSLSCFTKANRKKCLKIYSFTLRFVGSCLKGNKLEEIVFDHQNCKCIVNCFLSNYNKDYLSFSFRNRNPLRTKNLPTSIFESYNFKRSTSVKGNL
jgi:hypothetical protein